MSRKVRKPLDMGNGQYIRNLKDFKDSFSAEVTAYLFLMGTLESWMTDGNYEKELDAIKKVKPEDNSFPRQLCEAFGCEDKYCEFDLPMVRRRAQIQKDLMNYFPNYQKIYVDVSSVAENQEELEKLISEKKQEIYLHEGEFTVEPYIEKCKLIGIKHVIINVNSEVVVPFNDQEVEFVNIQFSEAYQNILDSAETLDVSNVNDESQSGIAQDDHQEESFQEVLNRLPASYYQCPFARIEEDALLKTINGGMMWIHGVLPRNIPVQADSYIVDTDVSKNSTGMIGYAMVTASGHVYHWTIKQEGRTITASTHYPKLGMKNISQVVLKDETSNYALNREGSLIHWYENKSELIPFPVKMKQLTHVGRMVFLLGEDGEIYTVDGKNKCKLIRPETEEFPRFIKIAPYNEKSIIGLTSIGEVYDIQYSEISHQYSACEKEDIADVIDICAMEGKYYMLSKTGLVVYYIGAKRKIEINVREKLQELNSVDITRIIINPDQNDDTPLCGDNTGNLYTITGKKAVYREFTLHI